MKKIALMTACFFIVGLKLQAQILNYSKAKDGIIFETQEGILKLRVISNDIVQVIASPVKELPQRKSLSEVDNLKPTGKYSFQESANEYVVKTSALTIKIDKADGTIKYFNSNGILLLGEQQNGRTFKKSDSPGDIAWIVEQKFLSPEDEAIYGLGQYQFDVMNWKNGHMEMKQQNTAIASPVIVSNKGYGLFWDNYSFTEFNPENEKI
jgi:alpha-D-xyloside xylohydrolase